MTRCPNCRSRVVRKSRDGKLKVRTRIVAMKADVVEVVCQKCGADVPLDLVPGDELRKALAEPIRRLVLKSSKPLDSAKIVP